MKIRNFTVLIDGADPEVSRKLEIPVEMNLHDLHLLIQAAMPWNNHQMYEFHCLDGLYWWPRNDIPTPYYPGYDYIRLTKEWSIARFLKYNKPKFIFYSFDGRDVLEHVIDVGRVIRPQPGIIYPRLVNATGLCQLDYFADFEEFKRTHRVFKLPQNLSEEEVNNWLRFEFDSERDVFAPLEKRVIKFAKRYNDKYENKEV